MKSAAEFLEGYKAGEAFVAAQGVEVAVAVLPEVSQAAPWGSGFAHAVEAAALAAEAEYLSAVHYLKGLVAA